MKFTDAREAFRHGSLAHAAAVLLLGAATLAGCSSNDDNNNTGGTPSSIAVVSGNLQTGVAGAALATPLVAQVKDVNGNVVSGATVTFTASGGSSLSSSTGVTDGSGDATTNLTLGSTAGADTVTASVSGVSTSAIFTFTATAVTPVATTITVVSGSGQTGFLDSALVTPLVVQVKDQNGLPMSGATVTFTATGGSTLSAGTGTTDASGNASTNLTLGNVAGTDTVTASVNGVATNAIFTFTANAHAGVATTISVVSGSVQTGMVDSALVTPLVVLVQDQNGLPMSGATVTFTATGGATLSSPTGTTNATGNATTNLTLGNTAGSDTVMASVNGVATNAVFTFTANAGPANAVVAISGGGQAGTAGTTLATPLVAQVNDAHGNPVAGATVVWTTTAGTVVGSGTTTTDATGKAQITFTLPGTAGPATVTATVMGTAFLATFTETAN